MTFAPFTSLHTKRLRLRKLKIADAEAILNIRSNERVNQFIDRPKTVTIGEAVEFIKKINTGIKNKESYYWGITLKNDQTIIGTICLWKIAREELKAETGYELIPDHHRLGIMYEALTRVMKFALNKVKLRTIEAYIDPLNDASARLLEKCGFIRDREEDAGDEQVKRIDVVYVLRSGEKK